MHSRPTTPVAVSGICTAAVLLVLSSAGRAAEISVAPQDMQLNAATLDEFRVRSEKDYQLAPRYRSALATALPGPPAAAPPEAPLIAGQSLAVQAAPSPQM